MFDVADDSPFIYQMLGYAGAWKPTGSQILKAKARDPLGTLLKAYEEQNACFCGRRRPLPWPDLINPGLPTYGCTECHRNTGVKLWTHSASLTPPSPAYGNFILGWDADMQSVYGFRGPSGLSAFVEMEITDARLVADIEPRLTGVSDVLGWLVAYGDEIHLRLARGIAMPLPHEWQVPGMLMVREARLAGGNVFVQAVLTPARYSIMVNVYLGDGVHAGSVTERVSSNLARRERIPLMFSRMLGL